MDVIGSDVRWAVVDVEVGLGDHKVHDIGALRDDGAVYHGCSKGELMDFLRDVEFVCGHNIIHHDAKYLFGDDDSPFAIVDTLYLSPLLFPERPYHRLLKDDKLMSEQMNNPVNDCEKARDLLMDEMACWQALPGRKQRIFTSLLQGKEEFQGFLSMVGDCKSPPTTCKSPPTTAGTNPSALIWNEYRGRICQYADVVALVEQYPVELAYALSLIDTTDERSITPGWVIHTYPAVEYVMGVLRQRRCTEPDCENDYPHFSDK